MRKPAIALAAIFGAFLCIAAVPGNPLIPLVNGRGVVAETNNTYSAGFSTILAPIFWVSDDSNVNETTGVAVDTGNEACAVVAMDCADTVIYEPFAAGDASELSDSTCATDQTNTRILLSFCF